MSGGRLPASGGTFGVAGPRGAPPHTRTGGRPELVAAIRAEIERDGPITFARFMQRALYEPNLGYYATSATRPTRTGDFLTAPELHPLFGHALARQVHQAWQLLGEPDAFVVREYGAGSGALVLSLLDGLSRMNAKSLEHIRYQPVELPEQLAITGHSLATAGYGGVLEEPAGSFVGCVLANEFLDALPVHRVVRRQNELRELLVDWRDGSFVETEGDLSSAALASWFADGDIELADGQIAEVSLELFHWMAAMAADLERGYAFIFDYGAQPRELYGARRAAGTLRAFRGHHVSSDPYSGVGEQDLTAHVDMAALRRAALAAGMEPLGVTTQAEFLMGCGLEELVAAEQAALPDEWPPRLLLRAAVARLIDPRQMGGYAAVALGRNVPAAELRGLSYRLPARG